MKFDYEEVDRLLAKMESILGRVSTINSDFQKALDAAKQEKKAA